MLQGSYGKEPFDLRLTVLRLLRQIFIIIGVTVLGVVLFGGGYYVKNVLLAGETLYQVTSVYHLEFDVEKEAEVGTIYINQVSWNTYMQTDLFLDAVLSHLKENNTLSDGSKLEWEKAQIGAAIEAFLASDLRMPSTAVTTNDPEKSLLIAKAVEAAMTREMADSLREVESITLVDSGEAKEVIPDVRVGRALILSAILSFFFILLILLIKETWDDSIYLPGTILQRYGLKCVGGMGAGKVTVKGEEAADAKQKLFATNELPENLGYLFANKENTAVCPVSEDVDPEEILAGLRTLCADVVGEEWFAAPAPLLCPEICSKLRDAEGILLVVNSGAHAGKPLERVLEFLAQQDCEVTAVLLTDVDEVLWKWYYLGR